MSGPRRFAWDRADAWLGLGSFFLAVMLVKGASGFGSLSLPVRIAVTLVFFLQPFFLARVIRHFHQIVDRTLALLFLLGVLSSGLLLLLNNPAPTLYKIVLSATIAASQLSAGFICLYAARSLAGLTAWRLNVTAIGAMLFALSTLSNILFNLAGDLRIVAAMLLRLMPIAMLAAYYIGLLPPRALRRLLQRGEEYRFMRRTAERPPGERGERVAADLAEAAMRSVAAAGAVVLLGRRPLTIAGASHAEWMGVEVDFTESSPIARTLLTEAAVTGGRRELEEPLAQFAAPAEQFLMLPVRATGRTWGVLCVTQLRASLFPSDDVDTLRRLIQHAAEILDHAQLLADERTRQQREAEARLDLILESLRDYAVITISDTGRITSWNNGAGHVFGHDSSAVMHQPLQQLFDDGAPWLEDELARVRAGTPMIADVNGRRRDGTTLTASLVIRPLQERGRDSGGFVIVMRDVSQQRLLEDSLRQAQKLEAIGRLAGGVAHDFNNMLTVIIGYAASLDGVENLDHRMAIDEIRKAGERAAALTRQLLAFSRQQVMRPRRVLLTDIVASVTPMLDRLVGDDVELVDLTEGVAPPVFADPPQIEQVIMNLVVNARDAMPTGGRITMRVAAVSLDAVSAEALTGREGPHVMLEVADAGIGMDAATQARMFEPFFTTKEIGRGTGLGLSMVYGAVHQMGGAIAVESKVGKGTTFRVYIPEHRDTAA